MRPKKYLVFQKHWSAEKTFDIWIYSSTVSTLFCLTTIVGENPDLICFIKNIVLSIGRHSTIEGNWIMSVSNPGKISRYRSYGKLCQSLCYMTIQTKNTKLISYLHRLRLIVVRSWQHYALLELLYASEEFYFKSLIVRLMTLCNFLFSDLDFIVVSISPHRYLVSLPQLQQIY